MHTSIIFLCCIVGHIAAYNVQRDLPYNTYQNPYSVNFGQNGYEPSQRLFWDKGGSNQVGGTGLWATITNKFPFLNKFGRMEFDPEYRAAEISQQYGAPNIYQQQYYQPQYRQRNVPQARDVGFTDDAVIITPPDVPIAPEFPTGPQFPTAPQFPSRPQLPTVPQFPVAPQPAPGPAPGYQYDKPLYRLELPHK